MLRGKLEELFADHVHETSMSPTIPFNLRMVVASVLLFAGVLKIIQWRATAKGQTRLIHAVGMKSTHVVSITVALLPVIELALAAWLLTGRRASVALVASTTMLALFSFILLKALRAGYDGPCTCFGSTGGDDRIRVTHIVLNIFLACISLLAAILEYGRGSMPSKSLTTFNTLDLALFLFLSLALLAVHALLLQIERFFSRFRETDG